MQERTSKATPEDRARHRPRVLMLTREYPPNVYGGAGIHVQNLSRELLRLADLEVRCFGDQNISEGPEQPRVLGFRPPSGLGSELEPRLRKAFEVLAADLAMSGVPVSADVVHCHTWYSMMAGLWIKTLQGIPLVVTIHSLEPLRPWKEEQLGRGYHLSSWMERTAVEAADAVIAVSQETRKDVLRCYRVEPDRVHVVHNGIDTDVFQRVDPGPTLKQYGIDPERPYIFFVGRIARQKGIVYLVKALAHLPGEVQLVLCAGSPDTPEAERAVAEAIQDLREVGREIHWIPDMVPVADLVGFHSGAALFVCPSIYEPFGIINLEAMACETPVVATRVGGIPEVVVDAETGILVPLVQKPPPDFDPQDPDGFARDLAAAVRKILENPDLGKRLGKAGRARVESLFTWKSIARRTLEVYQSLLSS